jgi:hypothetical protein
MASLHGFEGIIILGGASVNQDGGLATVIETPGARGVCFGFSFHFLPFVTRSYLLSQLLHRQYNLPEDVLISGLKCHI